MKRVLVADDDLAMVKFMAAILKTMGVEEIVEATDGDEALDRVNESEFDLLLLDWYMPVMSGLDLLRIVRKSGHQVPIVMVTAEAHKDSVIQALQCGATDYMVKPIDPRSFRARLDRYLRDEGPASRPSVAQARHVMNRNVVAIQVDASVSEALQTVLRRDVGGLPVVDAHRQLVGLITEEELFKTIRHPETRDRAVRDVMANDVVKVHEATSLPIITKMIEDRRVRRIPVVRNGALVGIITRRELLRYVTDSDRASDESRQTTRSRLTASGSPSSNRLLAGTADRTTPDLDRVELRR